MTADCDDSLYNGPEIVEGPHQSAPVVIIGAGPAGLTAAYELLRGKIRSVVLEADTVVGGIARTAEYKGYLFDMGGHRFLPKYPW